MKFVTKKVKSKAIAVKVEVETVISTYFSVFWLIFSPYKPLFLKCRKNEVKKQLSINGHF